MNRFYICLFVYVMSLWCGPAYATSPVAPKISHILVAGDRLLVLIPSVDGVQKKQLKLDANGQVDLELYGKLTLKGLNQSKATATLKKHLGHWLNDTSGVAVFVQERRISVMVTGLVTKPGRFELVEKSTVWVAIQRAGSVLPGADLTRVTIYRQSKPLVLNVAMALQDARRAPNMVLRSGDVIVVPSKHGVVNVKSGRVELLNAAALRGKVFVLGEVKQPGVYAWTKNMTPLMAIGLAGGQKPSADLHHGIWMTPKKRLAISLHPSSKKPTAVSCPPTIACILFIPKVAKAGVHDTMNRTITVLGEVKQQGQHQINSSVSLTDAVALAQGATSKADLEQVYVTMKEDGVSITSRYNLKKQLKGAGAARQVSVRPGQTVYVSPKEASTLSKVAKTVSEVAIIAAAFTLFAAIL